MVLGHLERLHLFSRKVIFLHIPLTKEIPNADISEVRNVVGVDLGLNFLAVSYNSKDLTVFFKDRAIKDKRAQLQRVRKSLHKKGTPSARRRLKRLAQIVNSRQKSFRRLYCWTDSSSPFYGE